MCPDLRKQGCTDLGISRPTESACGQNVANGRRDEGMLSASSEHPWQAARASRGLAESS